METRRRQFLTVCAVCAACFALIVLTAPWAVRRVVERRVTASLRAAGWEADDVRVRRITLHDLELAGIRLRRGIEVSAGRIRAEYSVPGLLQGKVDDVTVEQVRVSLDVTDGWQPVWDVVRQMQGAEGAGGVRIAEVSMRPLSLVLAQGSERWVVRLDQCTLTADPAGVRFLAQSEARDGSVRVELGMESATGGWTVHAEAPPRIVTELLRALGAGIAPESETGSRIELDLAQAGAGVGALGSSRLDRPDDVAGGSASDCGARSAPGGGSCP